MQHKISADAAALICRAKKAGKSSRSIAEELESKLGLKLDQRSISRFAARTAGQPVPKRPQPTTKPARSVVLAPRSFDDQPEIPPRPIETTLDEVEALEQRATRLQILLANDQSLPVRDTAALNAELRQTFASIRKAKAAKQEQTHILSSDAQATLARIRRFQEANKTYPTAVTAAEPETEDAPVPAATGTDSR